MHAQAVVQLAVDSGLTGHGGAGFPLHRKLEAVIAARGRAIVVANGAEGEPASAKDRWLLARRPHLVLDGLQLVARGANATDAFLYVNHRVRVSDLDDVLAERRRAGLDPVAVTVAAAPNAFISGEETAVVSHVSGSAALPRFKSPRVTERGVRGRPTLVSNVETLALLALIARRGAHWFRGAGTADATGHDAAHCRRRSPRARHCRDGARNTVGRCARTRRRSVCSPSSCPARGLPRQLAHSGRSRVGHAVTIRSRSARRLARRGCCRRARSGDVRTR